jgi:hypothetical protein
MDCRDKPGNDKLNTVTPAKAGVHFAACAMERRKMDASFRWHDDYGATSQAALAATPASQPMMARLRVKPQ